MSTLIPLIRLVRVVKSTFGTGGVLLNHDMIPICNTVERSWLSNEADVSCIPEGLYMAHRRVRHFGGPKSYEVFELDDVPGRSLIQIHIANHPEELKGCIAPVTQWWPNRGLAGTSSKTAFDNFMAELAGFDRMALQITNACVQSRDISAMITNFERNDL